MMEKVKFSFMNEGNNTIPSSWNSSMFGMEIQPNDMNCSSEELPNCFFNPGWDNSMAQSDPFESALSSIVSSPANSTAGIPIPGGENVVLRELIGRLGSISNSGEISPQSYINGGNNSSNTSCYNTPLNSPPKLNLSMADHQIRGNLSSFLTDPGFADRAARFSSFSAHINESEINHRIETGKFSRVSSNQSFKVGPGSQSMGDGIHGTILGSDKKFSRLSRPSTPENRDDSMEESSVSEQIPGGNIAKKRKSIAKGKSTKENSLTPSAKDLKVAGAKEESNAKRSKSAEEAKEDKKEKQIKESAKPPEPPKDYIHVRARRGQATDSHSLAERVRREKIGERMKFLQDLVPGCNKVTGKAVMLDEIINYVQSLQHQVEFLSMKLATVNPSMEISMETLLSKDIFQSRGSMPNNSSNSLNMSAQLFPYAFQSQHGDIPYGFHGAPSHSQASSFWENDLQSIVQMGISQNQPQNVQGAMTPNQMKAEP